MFCDRLIMVDLAVAPVFLLALDVELPMAAVEVPV